MSFGRADGRGYKISKRSPNDSLNEVMGSGLSKPDGGADNNAARNFGAEPAPESEGGDNVARNIAERASVSDDIEHFRMKAASAEMQKRSTDLLLRSEQQKNQRLMLASDEHRAENEALKSAIQHKDNQLSQQALQLEQQRKESDEQKEENTRLKHVISSKENQLIQKSLENEAMAKKLNQSRCLLSKLSERNETLAAIAEELSINFAQQNIKYSALERDRCTAEEKARDLSHVNKELQNSTNILQLAFEDNLQALDALRVDNSELKSKLQLMNASDHCNGRKERFIEAKLNERRELLALVKAVRSSATERKAQDVAVEGPSEFTTAEQVQATWDSFVQSNEAIVTVLRGGTWVEAIKLEKRGTSLNWVEYICDGVTECVPEEKILRKRKQRPRSYFESPPTPPNPNRRKRSKGIVTLPSRRL